MSGLDSAWNISVDSCDLLKSQGGLMDELQSVGSWFQKWSS